MRATEYVVKVWGATYSRTAWTGGDTPSRDWLYCNRALVNWFMDDQLADLGTAPTQEQLEIFRGRAELDAWATSKNRLPNPVENRACFFQPLQ